MKKTFLLSTLIVFFLGFTTLFASASRTITDMDGVSVTIDKKIERIANLWHANNQILVTLGGAHTLVATTGKIKKNLWFNEVFPEIKKIPSALNGDEIQIEEFYNQNVDLIIVSDKKYAQYLRGKGFKVLNMFFRNYEDMKTSIRITGELLGDEGIAKANEFIEYFESNIKKVTDITKDLIIKYRPRVLHIVDGSNLLKVDGKATIIDQWISSAGGENVILKEGNMIEITIEEIINANPDIIIVGGNNNEKWVQKILNDKAWSGLNAVKNKKVYGNPSGVFLWYRYGAEEALQILWAAKIFHPSFFKDIDIEKETINFYKKWMHYDLTPEKAQYILKGLSPKGE